MANGSSEQHRPITAKHGVRRRHCAGQGAALTVAAATAVLGLAGCPKHAGAFFASPACLRIGRERLTEVWASRQGPHIVTGNARRGARTTMTTGEATTEKELLEIIPPPDREKALQKVKEMEQNYNKTRNDEGLGAYATALLATMPKGPYTFQVPGEFGNDTLCTDPDWHTTLNSLAWLGCSYEVEHVGDEGEPNLVMGDEVYDDAKECLMMLPERSMLVDFVESLPKIANIVHKVQPAWLAAYLNTDKSQEEDLQKAFDAILDKVEKCFKYSQGDLLEGDELTIGDLELAVTTYHMIAAFGSEKKNWKIPSKFPGLSEFVNMMHDMECFKSVMPSKENVALRYKAMKQPR